MSVRWALLSRPHLRAAQRRRGGVARGRRSGAAWSLLARLRAFYARSPTSKSVLHQRFPFASSRVWNGSKSWKWPMQTKRREMHD